MKKHDLLLLTMMAILQVMSERKVDPTEMSIKIVLLCTVVSVAHAHLGGQCVLTMIGTIYYYTLVCPVQLHLLHH